MVRKTSIEVYNRIKNDGLLSERRWQIYDALYEHGPCTANELFANTRRLNYTTQANYHARLGELRELGVVQENKTRACRTNGNTVIEWDVSGRLPIKIPKQKKIKCKHCKGRGYFEQGVLF